MGSPLITPPVVRAQALSCPNCGGPLERRGFGHTLTIVCPQCLSVLDASAPQLQILQQVDKAQGRRTPMIPLGSRGNFRGATWQAIGFQTRAVEEDEWEEYLLFNPYKGFRYLTHYAGHWNFVTPTEALPAQQAQARVAYGGRRYRHFSTAEAVTTFVLGEFPWRAQGGDKVLSHDFVDPPCILSAEATPNEITWSQGEYVPGAEIWQAFGLPNRPPVPRGVYLNQPSPYKGNVGGMWMNFALMLLILIGLALFFATFSRHEVVLREAHHFSSLDPGEPSYVTKTFDLEGRPATLEVDLDTNLDQDWAYFNFALINDRTGEAYDFGREVSYYHDSDGSEGSPRASVLIPAVAPGTYYLRVEPEMDAGRHSMSYDLTLRHDVPSYAWFWIAAALLILPPIGYTMRSASFERQRWMESDHPPLRRGGD